MRSRRTAGLSALLVVSLLAALPSMSARAASTAPVTDSEVGRRVYDDLAAYYADPAKRPDTKAAFDAIFSSDPGESRRAADWMLALLRQLVADETNGRSAMDATPYWGAGAESRAHKLRESFADAFGSHLQNEATVPVLLWFIRDEPSSALQDDAVDGLDELEGDAAVPLLEAMLESPNAPLRIRALDEIDRRYRRGKSLEAIVRRKRAPFSERVLALCVDGAASVRGAARRTAQTLGLHPIPEFHPEDALTTEVVRDAGLVLLQLPQRAAPDAKWVVVRPRDAKETHGRVLGEDATSIRVLSEFGREETFVRADVEITPSSAALEAARLSALRGAGDRGAPDELSAGGGLTGQFESGVISLPEALVAAWALESGDRIAAAAVLVPCLDRAADARHLSAVTTMLTGNALHQQMLAAFSYDRDYPKTIALGRLLSTPAFDGYPYQARGRELADQLEKRRDDFVTFVLPTPEAWAQQRAKMPRSTQVDYLASRLRLLNCFQWGQPGGIDFSEEQHEQPSHMKKPFDRAENDSKRLVNPWKELKEMKLGADDIPVLLPWLHERNFLPTFGFWRDFSPDRDLYRVQSLVASLINSTAHRELVDSEKLAAVDGEAEKALLATVADWSRANAGKDGAALAMESLESTTKWWEFEKSMWIVVAAKRRSAAKTLIRRIDDFPGYISHGVVIRALYELDTAEAVEAARRWVNEPISDRTEFYVDMAKRLDPDNRAVSRGLPAVGQLHGDARFFSAMILLRHGDRSSLEGLATVEEFVAHDHSFEAAQAAADTLLSLGRGRPHDVLCSAARQTDVLWILVFRRWGVLRQLLTAKCDDALAMLTDGLSNTQVTDTTFRIGVDSRNPEVADYAASIVRSIRDGGTSYPFNPGSIVPPDLASTLEEREDLATWLTAEYALLRDGKSSALSAGN